MDIKELRVGNHIQYHKYRFLKKEINLAAIIEIRQYSCLVGDMKGWPQGHTLRYEELTAIPLTEDIILKFGFIAIKNGLGINTGYYDNSDNQNFHIQKVENSGFLAYLIGHTDHEQIGRDFGYVHELQNLYFAITGKELTLE